MQNHCINKLLNIEGIIIKKVVPNAHITNGPSEGFNNKIGSETHFLWYQEFRTSQNPHFTCNTLHSNEVTSSSQLPANNIHEFPAD